MTPDLFQQTLRRFLHQRPFEPFLVELSDGRQIIIDTPHSIAMNGDGAGFLSPEYDLISFSCEQVREVRLAMPERTS